MKVLFAVWELDPFIKIGGLGDVARSLPGALKKLGVDIRTIVPYYKAVKMGKHKKNKIATYHIYYAGKKEKIEVFETKNPYMDVTAYFLKNDKYLDIAASIETWGFFDKAVVELLKQNVINWQPDIVHVNDSHCGLIPILVKQNKLPIKTLLTIHNLAYQKKTSVDVIKNVGIDPNSCKALLWEVKEKQINFLLEAIIHADLINTVSPTYAKEILSEEFGAGLNEVLKGMEGRIFGILNGIDVSSSHTTHDSSVKYPYVDSLEKRSGKKQYYNWKEGKRLNKEFLQKKLKLKVTNNIPLFCFIGRIDVLQKGLDILHTMIRRINQTTMQVVILGSGDVGWEERYKWLSTFYPKNISCNFLFDDKLAHQIYAGADFIIIPSKYEPCGLIQMNAMLFGTLPIAHNTGGLKDSIKDGKNGFLFSKYSSEGLENKINKAIDIWKNDKKTFDQMVENALSANFSWNKSAEKYIDLYQKLLSPTAV